MGGGGEKGEWGRIRYKHERCAITKLYLLGCSKRPQWGSDTFKGIDPPPPPKKTKKKYDSGSLML